MPPRLPLGMMTRQVKSPGLCRRLKAVFNNIPAGVTLYTSTQVTAAAGLAETGQSDSVANLIDRDTAAASLVSATQTLDGIPAAALTSADGSATAVWELT